MNVPDLSKLPARLQAAAPAERREHIARRDGDGWTLTLQRVQLARGWRYEVSAEHDAVDHDGPVRRRDTVWLNDHDQAQRLYRAAHAALTQRRFGRDHRLDWIARKHGLRFTLQ